MPKLPDKIEVDLIINTEDADDVTEEKLRKQFVSKVETDDEERTVTATISTTVVDRDGEVVLAKGGMFDNFLKNPVVLFGHDSWSTPIGKALWITQSRNKIVAKTKFADTPKADEVYQLFKGGFMNAFSIGFIVKKSHAPTPDEIKKKPEWAEASRIFDEWELLEFSAVPVPANPEALATAVKTKQIELSKETRDLLDIPEIFVPEEKITVKKRPKLKRHPVIKRGIDPIKYEKEIRDIAVAKLLGKVSLK